MEGYIYGISHQKIFSDSKIKIRPKYNLRRCLSGLDNNKVFLYRFSLAVSDRCGCDTGASRTRQHLIFDCVSNQAEKLHFLRVVVLQRGTTRPIFDGKV